MSQHNNTGLEQGRIAVRITVGDYITIFEDVDMDEEKGFVAGTLFEGTVDQYNSETGLLRFKENDVGRAEFESLVDEGDGIQVI